MKLKKRIFFTALAVMFINAASATTLSDSIKYHAFAEQVKKVVWAMDLPQFKDKLHEFERIVERMADPNKEQRRSDPRPTSDSLFREAFGLNRRKE